MKKEWTNPEIEILDVRLTMKGWGGGRPGGGHGGGHGGGKCKHGHPGHSDPCPTPNAPPVLDS